MEVLSDLKDLDLPPHERIKEIPPEPRTPSPNRANDECEDLFASLDSKEDAFSKRIPKPIHEKNSTTKNVVISDISVRTNETPLALVHSPPMKVVMEDESPDLNETPSLSLNYLNPGIPGPAFIRDSDTRFASLQFKLELNTKIFAFFTAICCLVVIVLFRLFFFWIYSNLDKTKTERNVYALSQYPASHPHPWLYLLFHQISAGCFALCVLFFYLRQSEESFSPQRILMGILVITIIIFSFVTYLIALNVQFIEYFYFYISDLISIACLGSSLIAYTLSKLSVSANLQTSHICTLVLTLLFTYFSVRLGIENGIKGNDSSRALFVLLLPLVTEVFMMFLRLTFRLVPCTEQKQNTIFTGTLALNTIYHIILSMTILSFEKLSSLALYSILYCLEIQLLQHTIHSRDSLFLRGFYSKEARLRRKQLRISADGHLADILVQSAAFWVAFAIYLVFDLPYISISSELTVKFILSYLVQIIFLVFIPITIVFLRNFYILQFYESWSRSNLEALEGSQLSIEPAEKSSNSRGMTVSLKRTRCDLVNVWCSKHAHFKKHFILTFICCTLVVLRFTFELKINFCLNEGDALVPCSV